MSRVSTPKAISAATDWFVIQVFPNGEEKVTRVASWGLDLEGRVYGLVAGRFDSDSTPVLEAIDSGRYVHLDSLTDEQRRSSC